MKWDLDRLFVQSICRLRNIAAPNSLPPYPPPSPLRRCPLCGRPRTNPAADSSVSLPPSPPPSLPCLLTCVCVCVCVCVLMQTTCVVCLAYAHARSVCRSLFSLSLALPPSLPLSHSLSPSLPPLSLRGMCTATRVCTNTYNGKMFLFIYLFSSFLCFATLVSTNT